MVLQSFVRPAQSPDHPDQLLLAPREGLPGQVAETLQQALQLLKKPAGPGSTVRLLQTVSAP